MPKRTTDYSREGLRRAGRRVGQELPISRFVLFLLGDVFTTVQKTAQLQYLAGDCLPCGEPTEQLLGTFPLGNKGM